MKDNRPVLLAGLALALAALAAYANSFGVPFLFDDEPSIVDNATIRRLWPPWAALSPPRGWGFTVSGRPVLNLSLAVNYAISGLELWSYHVVNLLIHVLAGWALLGLVRRTLLRPGLAARFGGLALPTAFAVALLWTLHPLQTESVTYVIQRAESLMGLFYLLTLYGLARAADAPRPARWLAFSVAACLLGVGSKEVIVTAPVVALLYDRTFVAGSFAAAWRQRRGYHLGLAATWLPLAWLVARTGGDRGGTFVLTWTACRDFWLTQFEAVTRYVQLAVWPAPLVFDYGVFKVTTFADVAPFAAVTLTLLAATGWALRRRPIAGFLGAGFFLILAPTSLAPGVTQVIVEHRMYLPLAAVLALIVGGAVGWGGRRGLAAALALAVGAGGLTIRRNADYGDDLTLWTDSVTKRPQSATAQANLGRAHFRRGRFDEAMRCYREAIRLNPASAQAHFNLGLALAATGRLEEAVGEYREAVRILPYFAPADLNLGVALTKLGRAEEALAPLRSAVELLIEPAEAYVALDEAFAATGRMELAAECFQTALAKRPADADAHFNLGVARAALGRADGALASYTEAVRLDPRHGEARLNLGIALAARGRLDEARTQLAAAVRLRPRLPEAPANLGNVLLELGRASEAVASYERALRLRPGYATVHLNLGDALARLQRWPEARRHYAEAARRAPAEPVGSAARERLQLAP